MDEKRIKYPCVSEIYSHYMRKAFHGMDLEEIVQARELSNKVVCHCISIAKETWQMEIEDECKAYVDSFKLWKSANFEYIDFAEMILHDDVNRFTGRIDMIVKLKGSEDLVSLTLKTGNESKSWNLQLAAYNHLCKINHLGVKRSLILQLSKTGKEATLIEHEDLNPYWHIFYSILTGWQYFKGDYDV